MTDYLEEIVQNIRTKCDLSGFEELSIAILDATKKAKGLASQLNKTLTGTQKVQIAEAKAKAKEVASWNAVLREQEITKRRQLDAEISHNNNLREQERAKIAKSNEAISWNLTLKEKEKNAHLEDKLAIQQEMTARAKNNNETRIAMRETNQLVAIERKEASQNRLNAQLSRERVAQMRKELAEQRMLNRERRRGLGLGGRIGAYLGAYVGLHQLRNIVETGSRIQLVQKSIEGLTKSTQDWDFIKKSSFKLGIGLQTAATGYKNFYSSANMAGFDKNSIQGMYYDVMLSSRAIGASEQQTGSALLALEQMMSKSTVSMEELRKQLGNALPGAFEIGAKAMNMTTKEFNAFVKTGQLASNVFVPKFIKALVETYANGFKDIEKTVNVAQGRLKNAWENLTSEIVSGDAGKGLAQGLETITTLIRSPEFIQLIQSLGTIFSWVVKIITFAIRRIPAILLYLGARGLLGLITKAIAETIMLQMAALKMGLSFKRGATMASMAIKTALLSALKMTWRALWEFLIPIALIEEAVAFIGQQLGLWDVNSALGHFFNPKQREREGIQTTKDNENIIKRVKDVKDITTNPLNPTNVSKFLNFTPLGLVNPLNPANPIQNIPFLNPRKPNKISLLPMSNFGYGGGAYLNQGNVQETVIKFDINVNGSEEPTRTAYATYNVIKNELVGLGLTSNVESVVNS